MHQDHCRMRQTVLHCTLHYSTLLYTTLLYSTLHYSTLLYSTLLYSTLLYSTTSRIRYSYTLPQHLKLFSLFLSPCPYSLLHSYELHQFFHFLFSLANSSFLSFFLLIFRSHAQISYFPHVLTPSFLPTSYISFYLMLLISSYVLLSDVILSFLI